MKVAIAGTGYVGLVTGTCLSEIGHSVTCVDTDQQKISGLKKGIIPIYEPGLEDMISRNVVEERLLFTTSLSAAIEDAEVIFIAVGTPPQSDGSADLDQVLGVAREIGQHLDKYAVIVDKSTVPVGTAEKVSAEITRELSKRNKRVPFDVVSNPEFLKEGEAIDDFMGPDRIVVGTESDHAAGIMSTLYEPFTRKDYELLIMGIRDAEMTKYAANAMLATKISFMNEIANFCESMGVDVENVRHGIGTDTRIGHSFTYPGCGYGGSCFPKDVKALIHMARQQGIEPKMLVAAEERNQEQKGVLGRKIKKYFGDNLSGVRIGVWGLAFKPGTDDIREASSLELLKDLVDAGATVYAYDPEAMEAAASILPKEWLQSERIRLVENQYDAIREVDALVLVTEWNSFRAPDFNLMREIMRNPLIFDGRNIYDPDHIIAAGFTYDGIGKGTICQAIPDPSIIQIAAKGKEACLHLTNVS